jgi:hypothetical protein
METTQDSYLEHNAYHQSYHNDCSECWKERRIINAHKIVNRDLMGRSATYNLPVNVRPSDIK